MLLHRRRAAFKIHRYAKRIGCGSATGAVIAAALSKLPEKPTWGATYASFRSWELEHNWWQVISLTALAAGTGWVAKAIGSPKTWELLHSFLCDLQKHVFRDQQYSDNPSHHRVTLFKGRTWRAWWDIVGLLRYFCSRKPVWLVAVVRSGHSNQESVSWFRIGDSESECKGICGLAWHSGKIASVHDLPEVPNAPTTAELEAYSRKTLVSVDKVRKKHPKSRAILAVPIRVRAEMWGVLVFDSRNPVKIGHEEVDELCTLLANHISNLVESVL